MGTRILAALALCGGLGCATAEGLGDIDAEIDAGAREPDAPAIDAGPTAVTLSQTTSRDIIEDNSIACPGPNGGHAESSYYRVFDLAAEGIEADFQVQSVSLAIELSDPGAEQTQPITIKLHTLEGPLMVANLTELASEPVFVGAQTLTMLDVNIAATAPLGSRLVVEVFTPDGAPDNAFFMGSNDLGESAPGFIRSPDCNTNEPTDISTVMTQSGTPPTMDMILEVSGVY